MVLTALTVTTTTETTHLSGSSDSLEKRFQRDVNYLFMGCKLSAEVTCEQYTPASAHPPHQKCTAPVASFSRAI